MIKRILITGKNSYIGNQIENWLNKEPEKYEVVKESVRNDKWKSLDLSTFDVLIHVAGIAHQDTNKDQESLYYKVNTDLTIDIATKAKKEGVKQFIFLSSMIVYGSSSKLGEAKIITNETIPQPSNFYGNSKLLAERGIQSLQTNEFNVVIIRPPMIYGYKSKGNYPLLSKFAKCSPICPNIDNERSMLYIDNLTEFIRLMIDNKEKGLYFPQNKEYVSTKCMIKEIAKVNGHKIRLVSCFNIFFFLFRNKFEIINKVYGNLIYDKNLSEYRNEYRIKSFEESINCTERNQN